MNQCVGLGAECGDAEGHRNAVIAAGVDDCAVEVLAAGYVETVFKLLNFSAHRAEILRNKSDAVGLLDAQFFGVADADAAGGVRRDGSEDGQLVDQLRGEARR